MGPLSPLDQTERLCCLTTDRNGFNGVSAAKVRQHSPAAHNGARGRTRPQAQSAAADDLAPKECEMSVSSMGSDDSGATCSCDGSWTLDTDARKEGPENSKGRLT